MTKQERAARREKQIIRTVAVLLGAGGLSGCVIDFWMFSKLAQSSTSRPAMFVLFSCFLLVFAASGWTGWALWKGNPGAKIWAEILLAAQVPILLVHGFTYDFFTGVLFSVVWDNAQPKLNFNFNVGASITLELFTNPESWNIGVNLVALTALILMLRSPKPQLQYPTNFTPNSTPLNPQDLPPNP